LAVPVLVADTAAALRHRIDAARGMVLPATVATLPVPDRDNGRAADRLGEDALPLQR
jgi:hypothetical protein